MTSRRKMVLSKTVSLSALGGLRQTTPYDPIIQGKTHIMTYVASGW